MSTIRPKYTTSGVSGTQISAGQIIRPRQNPILKGKAWAIEADQMITDDTALSSFTLAMQQTLLSASWSFSVPDTASDQAKRARDYLNHAFGLSGHPGRLQGGFEAALRTLVSFVDVGFRYVEEIYEVSDGKVWLRKYDDRMPSAHYQWVMKDGELESVVQMAPDGTLKTIPADKILLLSFRRKGDDFEGVGLLRPCHSPWMRKRDVIEALGIGIDRMALPIPKMMTDPKAMEEAGCRPEEIEPASKILEEQIEKMISHEMAYFKVSPGLDVGAYEINTAFKPTELISVVQMYDQQMAQAYLMGFLMLGVNDTGSRAVGDVQETFFRRCCVNILDLVASAIGGAAGPGTGTAGRLLQWNFPDLAQEEYPILGHRGLQVQALLDVVGQFGALKSNGFLTPDDRIENAIRSVSGIQPLSPDQERSSQERLGGAGAMLTERINAWRTKNS